ncbi:MAG: GNAT family N-acetyltransferase [Calditrichaeota bacterium]|nr:GNAT family N-acetyltransferase [Calditrichota bacterium]
MKYGYKKQYGAFIIQSTTAAHVKFAAAIAALLAESARARGTGIAKRSPEYIARKIQSGKAIIALHRDGRLAGFTYIETWGHGRYVANSGLIVVPEFRGCKLGKQLKRASFTLSRKNFPDAKIFSITTSPAVMKMNTELGFRPVPLYELTRDQAFWEGCRSCPNFDILQRNQYRMCLCTGLLFDPQEAERRSPLRRWLARLHPEKWMEQLQSLFQQGIQLFLNRQSFDKGVEG